MLPDLQALQALSSLFNCVMFLCVAAMHGSIRATTLLLLTLLGRLVRQLPSLGLLIVGCNLITGLVLSMCLPIVTALAVSTVMPRLPVLVLVRTL